MGIQSYVIEAIFREQKVEKIDQELFQAWKKKAAVKK